MPNRSTAPLKAVRLRHALGQVAVTDADQIDAHIDDADRQQHLRQVPAFFGALEQHEIEQHADRGGDQRRQQQARSRTSRPVA